MPIFQYNLDQHHNNHNFSQLILHINLTTQILQISFNIKICHVIKTIKLDTTLQPNDILFSQFFILIFNSKKNVKKILNRFMIMLQFKNIKHKTSDFIEMCLEVFILFKLPRFSR